jgi:hypothetical protein
MYAIQMEEITGHDSPITKQEKSQITKNKPQINSKNNKIQNLKTVLKLKFLKLEFTCLPIKRQAGLLFGTCALPAWPVGRLFEIFCQKVQIF